MIIAISAVLVFCSGLAFGLALAVVTPEGALCLLLMALGILERWQRARAWARRWIRW